MEKSNKPLKKPGSNNFLTLIVIVLLISASFLIFNQNGTPAEKINLNQFIESVNAGEVSKIVIEPETNRINITKIDGSSAYTYKEPSTDLATMLQGVPQNILKDIEQEVVPPGNSSFWLNLLFALAPVLIIVAFFFFMMRQAQSSNNQAMSFGKSKAKLYDGNKKKTLFIDVAGADEAKEELVEIVDFLKNPGKYVQMGAKIPKGVLLVGSPGTGKTLLARAVAGEANVPFFSISGSEFVEMFVGVGASRVRDLFKKAQKNAPCIIFIDEIDAVGRQRGTGLGGGHDEREQTLNQILTEMDGFEGDTGVIVMAATNRPDVLDPALLRPGRFDRRVMVDLPDIKAREEILQVHSRNKPVSDGLNLNTIAKHTPGLSGADLENIMNEAAILAAKENRKIITQEDVQNSVEKIFMGPERKSRIFTDEEKRKTAYHEVGHAVVGHLCEHADPIHKITIISRGHALGVTWSLPEKDQYSVTRAQLFDKITMALGGYCAELEFYKELTTGASNDLEKATQIATSMVTNYGMSDLGPISLGEKNHEVFLGRDYGHVKNYSEETAKKIDQEVHKILAAAFERTKKIISDNHDLMVKITDELVKKENLNREEFLKFFEGHPGAKNKSEKKASKESKEKSSSKK
jgi:cell division protease FtsH